MNPLTDQVVLITGASSGIGRCLAIQLAAQGACLVLRPPVEDNFV